MKRFCRQFLLILILPGMTSCTGSNLFKDLSSKNSDKALYESAIQSLDAGNYTDAINDILATSAGYQSQSTVQDTLAGAYAGRCGMVFLTFVSNLSSGSGTFFKMALDGFVGVNTTSYQDCLTAATIINNIGTFTQRTDSENIFMAVLAIATIGNRLRNDADTSPAPYGGSTINPSFNCGPTQFPIADAAILIQSFVTLLDNLTALTSSIGTGSTSSLSAVVTACGASCTTVTLSTPPQETDAGIIVARALVNMQSIGLGSCNNPDPASCVCTSP